MKYLVLILLFITPHFAHALSVGDVAPNIYGRTLDQKLFRLSDTSGIRLVNFFWINCLPCVREMPELAKLELEYPQIYFASIHVEDEEERLIREFVSKLDAHPRNIVMAAPLLKSNYQIIGLPHTVLIHQGKIDSVYQGYTKQNFAQLKNRLEYLSKI